MKAWTISKVDDRTLNARDETGAVKATIINKAPIERFDVTFPGATAFDYHFPTRDGALGYVRGIERAVAVYAEETGRAPRRSRRADATQLEARAYGRPGGA